MSPRFCFPYVCHTLIRYFSIRRFFCFRGARGISDLCCSIFEEQKLHMVT